MFVYQPERFNLPSIQREKSFRERERFSQNSYKFLPALAILKFDPVVSQRTFVAKCDGYFSV